MITIQKFEEILKKTLDTLQTTSDYKKLDRLEYELTDAYLTVDNDMNPILFEFKVTSKYQFVMKMIFNKKFGI